MPVPNTDETFTAKSIYLIRIVRNHVHVFHEFDLRNSTTQLRMKFAKFANAKITLAFFFTQQVGGWTYYCHTDNFLIEWYEPCPMVFLVIKDQPAAYGVHYRVEGCQVMTSSPYPIAGDTLLDVTRRAMSDIVLRVWGLCRSTPRRLPACH